MRNFLIITIGFVLVSSHLFSQEVQAKLSKKTVQVGEPFTLNFEIAGTANYSIGSLGKKKRLAVLKQSKKKGTPDTSYIELTDKFNSKTEKIQGRFYWQGAFELIAFEEGVFVIPPMTFRSDKGKNIESNPVLLMVELVPVDKDTELYDIQENFVEIKVPFFQKYKEEMLCFLFIVLILVGVFVYRYYDKKRRQLAPSPAPLVNQKTRKEIAVDELNGLMKKELWNTGELKEHFTQLSFIVQEYLSAEMGMSFLEKTSLEIQLLHRQKGYSQGTIDTLGFILNVADMVKFAQSEVEKEGIYKVYEKAKSFIETFEKK